MRRALLAVCVLLALPAAGEARPFNAQEMRMVELAHDYWGKGPTCKRITYTVEPKTTDAAGWAGPCLMRLEDDPDLPTPFIVACAVVAHEWGHLLGHGHSTGIMAPEPQPTAQCLRADNQRVYRTLKKRCRSKPNKRRCVRRARAKAFA